ncbi:MAG: AI-2E family transporter [Fulvivirga sp.]|uniref:AI-2E family transporter n=3 Tax=Fulvivirga sp. TaxID=1931237 RepID=UPI0032EE11E2
MSLFEKSDRNKPLVMLQYLFFIVVILYLGQSLFIPLSIGLLISFVLYPFCRWLERHKVPRLWAIFIGLAVFLMISLSVVVLLSYQFVQFMHEWPELSHKLEALIQQLDGRIATSWTKAFIDPEVGLLGSFISYISAHVLPEIPIAIYRSSILLVLFIIIPVFSALILFYREVLVAFLYLIFPSDSEKYISKVMPDVIITYYNFIKGMGVVYLVVGILNSVGLFILGVPNPIFFGFVASILTFIPYVGITIGAILPMAVSWIKYDSVFYPIGVLIVFVVVQILEANIIFPLAVSQKLKINALITLVVIVAGGIVWGAMGMILFLPFVAILKLIADQIEEMKPIAVLLGTKKDIGK